MGSDYMSEKRLLTNKELLVSHQMLLKEAIVFDAFVQKNKEWLCK